jgi:hypothetical protein
MNGSSRIVKSFRSLLVAALAFASPLPAAGSARSINRSR